MTKVTFSKAALVLTVMSIVGSTRIFAEHPTPSQPSVHKSTTLNCCVPDPTGCDPDNSCVVSIYSR